MPFLPPNQQRQSTEGTYQAYISSTPDTQKVYNQKTGYKNIQLLHAHVYVTQNSLNINDYSSMK